MVTKFKECLSADYNTVESGGDYAIKREGETLKIFFEWSDGAEDWRNNFNFPAKPYRKMKNKWFAHRGFLKVWKAIEPYIADEINDASVKNIEVVGYSHGAAVAVLCYEYVKFNRPDVEVSGFGFGGPRVVWGFMRKAVKKRFEGFVVIRNGRDLVTHVPPALFGFRHVGEVVKIGISKGIIKDHYPARYMEALKIKKFVQERNEMLLKRDINELRKFINESPFYSELFKKAINNTSDEQLEAVLHQMIVNVPSLPEYDRRLSAWWLISHGYTLNK